MSEGAGLSAASTLATGTGPMLVLTAALFGPHRTTWWPITRADMSCGALAVVAVGAWLASGSGLVAVAFSIAADGLAGVPTIRKTWRAPETESPWGYAAGSINATVGLLTLAVWSPANWLFPVYILTICGFLLTCIAWRPRSATTA